MYAVIEDSAKQFRIKQGDTIEVDLREVGEDKNIVFEKVCLIENGDECRLGKPYVAGARVRAVVIEEIKGPKTISMHFKRRKGQHVRKGHRERFLRARIEAIEV